MRDIAFDHKLTVAVPSDFQRALEEHARARGLTLPDFVRRELQGALTRERVPFRGFPDLERGPTAPKGDHMHLPEATTYGDHVLVALANAVTDASTDAEARTVTYRRAEAAQACFAMAAALLNSKAGDAPQPSNAEVEALIDKGLRHTLAHLGAQCPADVLDPERPGFAVVTLA